jgi:hypothetical protein
MVDKNVQNKGAVKNAENAEATAHAQTAANENAAQGNLSKFIGQNPGPAQPGNAPSSAYTGANVPLAGGQPGAGMMNVPPNLSGGQISPQVLAMLSKFQSGAV